jgi:hypothetical protein
MAWGARAPSRAVFGAPAEHTFFQTASNILIFYPNWTEGQLAGIFH